MGRDIRTSLAAVRRQIGYCPQYNVLFDELTVEDHLIFFCFLKVSHYISSSSASSRYHITSHLLLLPQGITLHLIFFCFLKVSHYISSSSASSRYHITSHLLLLPQGITLHLIFFCYLKVSHYITRYHIQTINSY